MQKKNSENIGDKFKSFQDAICIKRSWVTWDLPGHMYLQDVQSWDLLCNSAPASPPSPQCATWWQRRLTQAPVQLVAPSSTPPPTSSRAALVLGSPAWCLASAPPTAPRASSTSCSSPSFSPSSWPWARQVLLLHKYKYRQIQPPLAHHKHEQGKSS